MEFRILGPTEADDDGRPLPLGGGKQRALLAILLLHANEVVSADRLVDDLWGGEAPGSGVAALQVRISQLRKALGAVGERLRTQPPGYLLRVEPGELDLDRFERLLSRAEGAEPAEAAAALREALGLWRGAPLSDFAYEPFAQAAIGRLEDLRLLALEKRVDADLALGRHGEIVGELETLVREQPLRERPRGQLILALYRSGRQADALEAYQQARRTLVDELGIDPSPALQELERAILRQDPSLDLAQAVVPERSILVAYLDETRMEELVSLAATLAGSPRRELILARALDLAGDLSAANAGLHVARDSLLADGLAVRAAAFRSPTPGADLVRLANEQDVDLVLVEAPLALLEDEAVAALLATAPCDVGVLIAGDGGTGPVLVPFSGADHDWAAVELAAAIARARDVPLRLAGSSGAKDGRDSSRLLASASLAIQRVLGVAAEPLLVEPGTDGLLRATESAGLVVLGLSERWQREGLGAVRGALVAGATPPVLLVRRGLRPGALAPPASLTRFTWTLGAGS
jgi:DNA-binding SARP family transcriptional activator